MGKWMVKPGGVIGIITMSLVLAIGCTQAPRAAAPEEFYRGKTVTLVASSGPPGGQDDLLARAVAPHLGLEIGATIKVENMGTDEGVNFVYTEAKRDGLTLVTKNTSAIISNDVLKAPGTLYETEKMTFLVDVYPTFELLQLSPKSPYKTLEALRQAKGLKGGGTTAKGFLALGAAVMAEILGLDAKVITGFNGKKDLTLAIARGEVDYLAGSDTTAIADERDGYLITLLTVSEKRSPAVPNAPTIFEQGVKVSKELEAAYKFIATGGFATAAPPEVPKERTDYLRKVYQKLSDSKDVQDSIRKVTGDPRPFIKGEDLQRDIIAVKENKELAQQLDALLGRYKASQ